MAKRKIVVLIKKNPNENNASITRRFSRKVQESGIIQKVKSKRYNERATSDFKAKKNKLKRLEKRKQVEKLKKLGKIR